MTIKMHYIILHDPSFTTRCLAILLKHILYVKSSHLGRCLIYCYLSHAYFIIISFFSAGLVTMADESKFVHLVSSEARDLWGKRNDIIEQRLLCLRCEQPYNNHVDERKVMFCKFTTWCITCVFKYGEEIRFESCTCSDSDTHQVNFNSSLDWLPIYRYMYLYCNES